MYKKFRLAELSAYDLVEDFGQNMDTNSAKRHLIAQLTTIANRPSISSSDLYSFLRGIHAILIEKREHSACLAFSYWDCLTSYVQGLLDGRELSV